MTKNAENDQLNACYISLVPAKIVSNVEISGDSHLTILYIEKIDWNHIKLRGIIDWVCKYHLDDKSITLPLNGLARFVIDETKDALVTLLEPNKEIIKAQTHICNALKNISTLSNRSHYWTPHITLKFLDKIEKLELSSITGYIEFSKIRLKNLNTKEIIEWELTRT